MKTENVLGTEGNVDFIASRPLIVFVKDHVLLKGKRQNVYHLRHLRSCKELELGKFVSEIFSQIEKEIFSSRRGQLQNRQNLIMESIAKINTRLKTEIACIKGHVCFQIEFSSKPATIAENLFV